jgi:hypothetical protein
VSGNPPPVDFSDDPGLVFSPHIYGGSIVDFLTVDQNWDVMLSLADQWQTSLWVGEYGWWDDPAERPEILERVRQFALREDQSPAFVPVGSAWWQWVNGCGDPHQITEAGMEAPAEIRQYRVTRCIDGAAEDAGVVPEWREILTRPTVRFAPGWITTLASDPSAGTLALSAEEASPGAEVELWTRSGEEPSVSGAGIADISVTSAGDERWTITAAVCAATYEVTLAPPSSAPGAPVPESCG